MEAFEQFVAVALESQNFVVSSAVKFPVRRQVQKKERVEFQTHGYEVDLVAARADSLVLASVKSFFGSRGVQARHVRGEGSDAGLYRLLNDPVIRDGVVAKAAERYGYRQDQVSLRLYVGKFAGKNGGDEEAIKTWCRSQHVGAGPIEVVGLQQVVEQVISVAASRTYIDNSVIVTMKVLAAAGLDLKSVAAADSEVFDDADSFDDD